MKLRSRTGLVTIGLVLATLSTSVALADEKPAAPPPAEEKPAARSAVQVGVELAKKAVAACLLEDETKAFGDYLTLLHPDRKSTETAILDIRRYSWREFRKRCKTFVREGNLATMKVERAVPDPVPSDAIKFKVYFLPYDVERLPAPVGFRLHEGQWWIDTNSL